MIRNFFKTGIRNILKYKLFSVINIFGLATGMSVCMLIIVMFSEQKEYDQFHKQKDNIYRILTAIPHSKFGLKSAVTSTPLANSLKNDYAVIKTCTHLSLGVGGDATYNKNTIELRGYFADQRFFKVFDFPLEAGDPKNVLSLPNSIVITNSAAVELFGSENPIGKVITFADRGLNILKGIDMEKPAVNWGEYTITGVIRDSGSKSHLRFDVLMSESSMPILVKEQKLADYRDNWLEHITGYTYVTLQANKTDKDLALALDDILRRHYSNIEEAQGLTLSSQKLTDITPGPFLSSPSSFSLPVQVYYFLAALAFVIMISACLNYTNLATARSLSRVKEIGVRKVTGASRSSLIFQFIGESVLTSMISLGIAIGLLYVIRPAFNNLWINQYLKFDLILSPSIYIYFIALASFIGVIAGIYPAVFLSRFQPIKVLKNQGQLKAGRFTTQKLLSTVQFVVSLFFIVTALLMHQQFQHYVNLNYGFVSKNVINVTLQSADYNLTANAFANIPGVVNISACDEIVGSGQGTHGMTFRQPSTTDETTVMQIRVDENFISNLDLTLIAGRNLPDVSSGKQVVMNESAVRAMGYKTPQDILGAVLESNIGEEPVEVIGVVKDFRFRMASEKEVVEPLVLRHQETAFRYLQLKVVSEDMSSLITQLEREWKKLDANHAFKYKFFDDQLRATNKGLLDIVNIINAISFLAVSIACMGLLGMITYQTERKKKEIGIRKVLGADMLGIVIILSKSFAIMLGAAVIVGGALSYFANNLWLESLPNRVDFGPGIILSGASILLALGIITICSQTIGASKANPTVALRTE